LSQPCRAMTRHGFFVAAFLRRERLTFGCADERHSAVQAPPILEARKLTKTYRSGAGELTVLADVSFEVERGSTCAILGPSGSGKTTLLGLCAGLDQPSSGDVLINGASLGNLDEDARAALRNREVGFVFQSFQLMSNLTALENVTIPLELRGERNVADRARDLLGRVGLGERSGHYPTQLSGGEQQRVALARAFINQPKLLFADEPTGNLDGETSGRVVDLIFELNRELGTALILVTHDLELARKTERVIRLRCGRVDQDSGAAS
jgi:putative ABC transport system ATP-binding protein